MRCNYRDLRQQSGISDSGAAARSIGSTFPVKVALSDGYTMMFRPPTTIRFRRLSSCDLNEQPVPLKNKTGIARHRFAKIGKHISLGCMADCSAVVRPCMFGAKRTNAEVDLSK